MSSTTISSSTTMIRFIAFLVLLIGGMEVIQPARVLARVTARTDLYAFQRRQTTGEIPFQCETICNPINGTIPSDNCPPSQCCLASFETAYFNCFVCVGTSMNATDYSVPQSIIDTLYDQCADSGFQLPVLTFPGQSLNRTLSSVVLPSSSSQTTVSTSASVTQITLGPATQATTNAPIPTSTLSSGIRSVETSCFNVIAGSMMLGTWFFFAV